MSNVIIEDGANLKDIIMRPYDFSRDDRRLTTFERAIRYAEWRAAETGARHIVRKDPDFPGAWLVQEVGS